MGRLLPQHYSGAPQAASRSSVQMALRGWPLLADPLQEGGVSVKEK